MLDMTLRQLLAEKPIVFSAVFAILAPFAIMIIGYLIALLQRYTMGFLASFIGGKAAFVVVNYLLFPGVMIHECAHALMAVLTGAKVFEVALFRPEGNSLGHVKIQNRGGTILRSMQNILIASAPMYIGAAVLYGCRILLLKGIESKPIAGMVLYVCISVFFHMTMSKEDIKLFTKGIPIFMILLFGVAAIVTTVNF